MNDQQRILKGLRTLVNECNTKTKMYQMMINDCEQDLKNNQLKLQENLQEIQALKKLIQKIEEK